MEESRDLFTTCSCLNGVTEEETSKLMNLNPMVIMTTVSAYILSLSEESIVLEVVVVVTDEGGPCSSENVKWRR
ncbi:hypothetical protein L6452_17372 [Arctium lappa]|uniref:Uncharacterized protein n=1 Tax=Arctium lappa TaxID=4217 RepID=A0ACB9C3D8_ARCLA|nr:hypothetical protein L6452_17372 [Arctium lappa]